MRPPLSWVHGNLLFGADERDCWALYELDGVSYPHLAVRQQLELLSRLAALLYRLEADFQLLRVSRPLTAADHERVARAASDPRHARAKLFDAQLECDLQRLAARTQHAPHVFLAVSLRPPVPGLAGLADGLTTLAGGVRRALGLDSGLAVSEKHLAGLRAAERRCRERIEAYVDCQPASSDQVQWLVRRTLVRGLGDPPVDHLHKPQALCVLDDDGQAHWRPASVELMRWHDALVHHQPRTLTVHSEQGESHQAQLVLGALPDELRFPGEAELLFWPLERLDFAVDVCLHAAWVANRDAVSLARKRRADAENFLHEESAGHGAPSAEALERPYAAQELEHVLTRPDRPPLLRCDVVLSVGAPTESELEERVDRLRTEYAPITVHRPTGDQHRLLLSTLPAQRAPLSEYTAHLLADQVAALMPLGVDAAGSELGLLCGHTLSAARRAVRLDLAEACQRSRAPTVLLLGTLGSGKTIALQTLAYRAWVSGSGPVVDIDPKGDHRLDALPGVITEGSDRNLEVVELTGDGEHRGLLDPLRIGESGEREDLAYAFLTAVLPQPLPAPWQTELRLAVQTAAQAEARSCSTVLDALHGGPQAARDCARALAVHATAGLAQLGVADPDAPPPDVGGAELVSLRIRHLRLPAPGKARADCDEQERLGCALLRLLAAYALRLTSTDPGRHSVVCVDEAWALLEHAPEVIARLSRLGRSQNVTPLIASQRIGDVDALDGLVGSALVFGLDSDSEAQRALALLRQDPDDEQLRRRLLAFRAGRCLYLDNDGRLTAMQFEVTDPRLLAALDTTPGAVATRELAGATID